MRRAPQRRSKSLARLPVVPLRVTSYRIGAPVPVAANRPLPLPAGKATGGRAAALTLLRRVNSVSDRTALPVRHASITPERLTLSLPVPPSINHQYATVRDRRVLTASGRNYKAAVAHHVLLALARTPHRQALLQALQANDLSLAIRFYFASPLRRDVDSGLKIAQDALCEALGVNDNRIIEIHLYKTHDARHPHIEVTLSTLPHRTQ